MSIRTWRDIKNHVVPCAAIGTAVTAAVVAGHEYLSLITPTGKSEWATLAGATKLGAWLTSSPS